MQQTSLRLYLHMKGFQGISSYKLDRVTTIKNHIGINLIFAYNTKL